jgi:hypothetical protein
VALAVSAGAAIVGLVLAIAFLPGRRSPRRVERASGKEGELVPAR